MSASLKLTDATALQAYARKFEKKFLSQLYTGFTTAQAVTQHANVKGQLVLTQAIIGNLVKRWDKTFAATADAIEFTPRTLSTKLVKIDLEIYPQEYEGSYLAEMMKPGQNPDKLPFEKFILDKILAKKNEECENAVWVGDEAAVPASTDLLAAVINGFMTIAKDEATAGNLTPVVTGALTDSNAVAAFENVYKSLKDVYKKGTVDIWCSKSAQIKYIRDYRTKYGAATITKDYMQFDLGNVNWHISDGTGDFILMTPAWNMHYGFDAAGDESKIRAEASKRAIALMMDFRIGVQYGIVDSDVLAINDQ